MALREGCLLLNTMYVVNLSFDCFFFEHRDLHSLKDLHDKIYAVIQNLRNATEARKGVPISRGAKRRKAFRKFVHEIRELRTEVEVEVKPNGLFLYRKTDEARSSRRLIAVCSKWQNPDWD